MKRPFNASQFFREHPEVGKYSKFCSWCYSRGIRPGKIKGIKEAWEIVIRWQEDQGKTDNRFFVRPWFVEHYSKYDYEAFYRYCREIRKISMKDINDEHQLDGFVNEWYRYKKIRNAKKEERLSAKKLLRQAGCEALYSRFCGWYRKKYRSGFKKLDEKTLRERTSEYLDLYSGRNKMFA